MKIKLLIILFPILISGLAAQSTGDDGFSYSIDTIISPSCPGLFNGSITMDKITVPGDILKYEWNTGQSTKNLTSIRGGQYQLSVHTRQGNIYKTAMITVPEPRPIDIFPELYAPTHEDSTNGFFEIKITGGTSPYSLAMITEQDTFNTSTKGTHTFPGIGTGAHHFYVMDANGCLDSTSTVVDAVPCELLASFRTQPAECQNNRSGSIELFIEEEVPPVTIEWSNGVRNQTAISNLDKGIYHVKIEDKRGCQLNGTFEIEYKDLIPPQVFARENINLYLDSKGHATLELKDFLIRAEDKCHNDLTFHLDKADFSCKNVGVNEVNFLVTDGVGNTTTKTITVTVRDTHSLELIYQDTVYTALCNGIAQYPPPTIRGLCKTGTTAGIIKHPNREINAPGTYTDHYYYVVKPGDTVRAEVTVVVRDHEVSAFLIVRPPDCNRGDDGSVSVVLRDEKEPVEYLWNDGSTDHFIFGIRHQNRYAVTVREASGCWFELSARTEGPDSLRAEVADIREHDGRVDIITHITGGNPPLSYEWRANGKVTSFSKNLIGVPDGVLYTLEVFDAKNCRSHILRVDRSLTAAEDAIAHHIRLFPNPGSGSQSDLHIDLGDTYGMFQKILLMNNRQEVLQFITNIHPENKFSTTDLPPGIYFIQFISEGGKTFTKKYLKI